MSTSTRGRGKSRTFKATSVYLPNHDKRFDLQLEYSQTEANFGALLEAVTPFLTPSSSALQLKVILDDLGTQTYFTRYSMNSEQSRRSRHIAIDDEEKPVADNISRPKYDEF